MVGAAQSLQLGLWDLFNGKLPLPEAEEWDQLSTAAEFIEVSRGIKTSV